MWIFESYVQFYKNTMEKLIKQGNEKAFEHFKFQYGKNNFDILKEKLLRNESTLNLFSNTDIVNIPTAENLLDAVMKNDYINIVTYCEDFSAIELEKKNDYLYFSALIILNEWSENYLPHILDNTATTKYSEILKDGVWFRIHDVIKRLRKIYYELEENYKI